MSKIKINHEVLNKFNKNLTGWGNFFQKEPLTNIKLNSNNFRCDEFVTDHSGDHLLFSGCSATFGIGLEEDEIWSQKLYKKIKQTKEVSGYFNLAMPGTGCLEIVANIFKYIDKFGKPDSIFVCLPTIYRNYVQINADTINEISKNKTVEYGSTVHAILNEEDYENSSDVLKINTFHYLLFLELYCKSNDIKLYTFSWDYNFPKMDLDKFFVFSTHSFIKYFNDNADFLTKEKYSITSRDDEHVGTAYHYFWSDCLYDIYTKEDKNVN